MNHLKWLYTIRKKLRNESSDIIDKFHENKMSKYQYDKETERIKTEIVNIEIEIDEIKNKKKGFNK